MDQRLRKIETSIGSRYDADRMCVLVFGLLIIHHAASAFMPWSTHLLLIWNKGSWLGITRFIEMINPWGIPLLFVVSGMGLRLAIERRNWLQFAGFLSLRMLLPLAFSIFIIGPLSLAIAFSYYYGRASYVPTPGHLWFLGNLLIYVPLLFPILIWVKHSPNNWLVRGFEHLVGAGRGLGVVFLAVPLILEAILVKPMDYVSYPFRWHGFVLGLICFVLGFLFVTTGETGRNATKRLRFAALALGFGLALARLFKLWSPSNVLLALESMSWIIAVWGFASRYLDKPSKTLRYLSTAVFPVYIIHLPVQLFVSSFILPLGIHPLPKLFLLVVLTLSGSLGLYEIVKRIRWVRALFGMR